VLLRDFLKRCTQALEALYPASEARSVALWLCREKLGVESYTHIVNPSEEIPEYMLPELEDDVRRLVRSEPLQYVLGSAPFCGRKFKVGPGVLIPRPETELLVEMVLEAARLSGPGTRILDLCTGSGCIAWTLALEIPGSEIVAVDISEEALTFARCQFSSQFSNQFSGQGPVFVNADILSESPAIPGGNFDFIVSNPPYVMEKEKTEMRKNVLDYEPSLALFVPDDNPLLYYRAIARISKSLLKPGGEGIVEINEALGEETAELFSAAGFKNVQIIDDLSGRKRMARFQK